LKKPLYFFIITFCTASLLLSSCRNNTQTPKPEDTQPPTAPQKVTELPQVNKEASPTLRFVVMADSRGSNAGLNERTIKQTMEQIKKLSPQPSFAVMPGDLVGGSKASSEVKSQLIRFKDIVTKYYPIEFYYPGFGNHEAITGAGGEVAFKDVFSEFKANFLEGYNRTVYYFDSGDNRFYMLNSNHPKEGHLISDAQLNWLRKSIDSTKKHNFFFFHEPAYPTGAHIGSSLDANPLQRNTLWQAIDSCTGAMVFCGHEHNYTRRHIDSSFNSTFRGKEFKFSNKVYQVTTGTFGAPFYSDYKSTKNVDIPPITQYHFAVVDVSVDKTQVNVFNLDGKLLDSFQQ
jgi:hypothetical protein